MPSGKTLNLELPYSIFPDDDLETFNFDADLKAAWDIIDEFAGDVNAALASLQGELKQPVLFFSNNSGKLSATGQADFPNKKDNSTVTITADSGRNKLIMTGSQGTQNIISTSGDITGFSVDGNYVCIWDYAANQEVITTNTVFEQSYFPDNSQGVNGDLCIVHLGINSYFGLKKVAGVWVDYEFSLMYRVVKTDGTLGTPKAYAYNGRCYIESLAPVWPSITQYEHNLGTTNIKKTQWLVNLEAQWGYTPGQKTPLIGYRSGSTDFDPVQMSDRNTININLSGHALCVTAVSDTVLSYVNYPSQENKWNVELLIERGF